MTTSRRRRLLRTLALPFAFAVFAAACGDDDDEVSGSDTTIEDGGDTTTEDGGDTTTEGDGGEEPSGSVIKIGVTSAETGRSSSSYDQVDDVAFAWQDWVNDNGGINGHPVEIVHVDNESQADIAVATGDELINEDIVALIIQDSTTEVALVDAIEAADIPVIGGSANSTEANTTSANYFTLGTTNPANAASAVVAAAAVEAADFGSVVCAEVPACAQADALYGPVAESLGLEYLGIVPVGAADANYTAACLEFGDAEFLNLGLDAATLLRVIEDCNRQGFEGRYGAISNSVVETTLDDIDGLAMAGSITAFPWWVDEGPVEEFRSVMDEYGDGIEYGNPSSTSTWAALELFRTALADVDPEAEVTTDDVFAAYYALEDETLDGLLPNPVSFTEGEPSDPVDCFWLFDYADGEFSSVTFGESGNGASGDLQSSCFSLGG